MKRHTHLHRVNQDLKVYEHNVDNQCGPDSSAEEISSSIAQANDLRKMIEPAWCECWCGMVWKLVWYGRSAGNWYGMMLVW